MRAEARYARARTCFRHRSFHPSIPLFSDPNALKTPRQSCELWILKTDYSRTRQLAECLDMDLGNKEYPRVEPRSV